MLKTVITISMCLSFVSLNSQNLKIHQWENRVLIIKTSNENLPVYKNQIKEFEDASDDLAERKFVVYQVNGNDFKFINYNNSALNTSGKISNALKNNILNKSEDFEIILIGLDGGVKLQQNKLLTKDSLFSLVDAMPMRRETLKRNKN